MNKEEYDEYLKTNFSEEQINAYDYFKAQLVELDNKIAEIEE